MNYTETIRNYLNSHQGEIFDLGYEYDTRFGFIDKKTFTRIIGRLAKEEILTLISKGVYFVNGFNEYNDSILKEYYCNASMGMVIGSAMFQNLCIKKNETQKIELITNKTKSNKNIRNIKVVGVDLTLFDKSIEHTLKLLEVFEKLRVPYDENRLVKLVEIWIEDYDDLSLEKILNNAQYSFSTIIKLKNVLDSAGIMNNAIAVYERSDKRE